MSERHWRFSLPEPLFRGKRFAFPLPTVAVLPASPSRRLWSLLRPRGHTPLDSPNSVFLERCCSSKESGKAGHRGCLSAASYAGAEKSGEGMAWKIWTRVETYPCSLWWFSFNPVTLGQPLMIIYKRKRVFLSENVPPLFLNLMVLGGNQPIFFEKRCMKFLTFRGNLHIIYEDISLCLIFSNLNIEFFKIIISRT